MHTFRVRICRQMSEVVRSCYYTRKTNKISKEKKNSMMVPAIPTGWLLSYVLYKKISFNYYYYYFFSPVMSWFLYTQTYDMPCCLRTKTLNVNPCSRFSKFDWSHNSFSIQKLTEDMIFFFFFNLYAIRRAKLDTRNKVLFFKYIHISGHKTIAD